jgi:hypothetical protein
MTKCFVDPELYDKPVFNYQSKPVNPQDIFSKTERKAVSVMYVKEPTVPFTPKNLDNYTLHVQIMLIVSLYPWLLKMKKTDESPRSIPNHEDFKNRQFDELWEWATIPRFSLDRSVRDQLQDRQYG